MDAADRPGRVIVGVDTGLAGLQALRVAVTEARIRTTALHAVRVWQLTPPLPGRSPGLPGRSLSSTCLGTVDPADSWDDGPGPAGPAFPTGGAGAPGIAGAAGPEPTRRDPADPEEEAARAAIVEAFAETMGGPPPDLDVHQLALPDTGGRALIDYACREGDLLVLGAPRRSRWRRLWGGSTVRSCVTRAACPVLVVPPPPLARRGSPRALLRELRREIDDLAGPGPEA